MHRPLLPSGCMAAKVTIVNNGPIRIEGEFTIEDSEGNSYGLARANRDFSLPLRHG